MRNHPSFLQVYHELYRVLGLRTSMLFDHAKGAAVRGDAGYISRPRVYEDVYQDIVELRCYYSDSPKKNRKT